ncbi:MAG: hypothetical protein OMM_09139 [Candidatus Magnetoglobus multicellularis str. Araruama]|uniref:Uncharacterized protein n=1 Tax=Candidatus Magnetoglobus multicellularis str. Araruama TaxID=890399 RepID=A0A1V1P543_9BACT|nr:MAG: hypothetical protein OMM_09139 [Candidatus Magnetoglobus multicellularis str. Araruama]
MYIIKVKIMMIMRCILTEKNKYWKIADLIRKYIEKNSESLDSKIRKLILSHFSLKEETNIDQLVKQYSKKKIFFQAAESAYDDVLLSLLNNEEISVNTLNDNNPTTPLKNEFVINSML